jgi:hypothetical protein
VSRQTRARISNVLLPLLGVGTVVAIAAGGHALRVVATTLLVLLSLGSFLGSVVLVVRRRRGR